MAIEKDVLDRLLDGRDPKDVFNKDGLVDELKKALSERILNTELDEHLDDDSVEGKSNHRNGYSKKSVLTGTSKMTLSVPRDRAGTFDPKLIAKYQRRFPDFDDKIISMYARGMTVREIRGHLEELYGIDVSPDLISAVTDAVLDEVAEWQNRPLDICYPLVFFDAIRVKVRDEGFVRNKAIYIALGVLSFRRLLAFDDMHSTGFFSWDYLFELGRNRDKYLNEYLAELAQKGLSRAPAG